MRAMMALVLHLGGVGDHDQESGDLHWEGLQHTSS